MRTARRSLVVRSVTFDEDEDDNLKAFWSEYLVYCPIFGKDTAYDQTAPLAGDHGFDDNCETQPPTSIG